jgi:hypothetical protein
LAITQVGGIGGTHQIIGSLNNVSLTFTWRDFYRKFNETIFI